METNDFFFFDIGQSLRIVCDIMVRLPREKRKKILHIFFQIMTFSKEAKKKPKKISLIDQKISICCLLCTENFNEFKKQRILPSHNGFLGGMYWL